MNSKKDFELIDFDQTADRCICCGEIIPEGRMLCPNCEAELWPKRQSRPQAAAQERNYL